MKCLESMEKYFGKSTIVNKYRREGKSATFKVSMLQWCETFGGFSLTEKVSREKITRHLGEKKNIYIYSEIYRFLLIQHAESLK